MHGCWVLLQCSSLYGQQGTAPELVGGFAAAAAYA
jgi:hypothetical protein